MSIAPFPAPPSVSPVVTPKIGPSAYGPQPARKTGQFRGIPSARLESIWKEPKTPHFDALLVAAGKDIKSRVETEARRATLEVERREKIETMLQRAAGEGWSQRELARRAGLAWSSWCRLRTGQADLHLWLPKLHAAATRLQEQPA